MLHHQEAVNFNMGKICAVIVALEKGIRKYIILRA